MTFGNLSLKKEEEAIFRLRALYEQYGYTQYKMSKFEEYDLYVRNKSFLVSDSIITFTDTSGKLMALKPDVTLSIVKNSRYENGQTQKLYYNENVYRISGQTKSYKELLQVGLECIGDIDAYSIGEVLSLAEASLSAISSDYILDISHMGLFSMLLDRISFPETARGALSEAVAHKNLHDAARICQEVGVSEEGIDTLLELCRISGTPDTALAKLAALFPDAEWKDALKDFSDALSFVKLGHLRIDFSVINDMNYYNGIVFQGFVNGIPESILSGGQYDKLMARMHKNAGAVGFAVYLDQLEALERDPLPFDVDTVILYNNTVSPKAVHTLAEALIADGLSVSVQKALPEKLSYRQLLQISESGVDILETNA